MKVQVSWNGSDLTATVDVESKAEAYGLCGEFWFDQGGHGDMGFPDNVEVLEA